MNRTPFSASRTRRGSTFRPQVEVLEHRLAPGSLPGTPGPPDPGHGPPAHARKADDLAILAGMAASQSQGAVSTTRDVVLENAPSTVVGESTVMRTKNGVTAHLTASGLEPGVYTFWMRVDAPGLGPVAGRLAGHVVGEGGNLNVSAHVKVGEVLSGHATLPSGPLQDPLHATITLVVRFHGPAEPGRIHEQTHTFEDGTAVNFLRSTHAPPP
jgi:hypothetical protein